MEYDHITDPQELARLIQQTQNQIFAAQNFRDGQMYVTAKANQAALMRRAEQLLHIGG